MPKRPQSPKEELANAGSHALGLVMALMAIPFLILRALEADQAATLAGAIIFSIGILMVYTFSTLYHAISDYRRKSKLQVLDHVSIYFLIAGTYTPMILAVLPPDKAVIYLSILWGSVLVGSTLKVFFTGRFKILSVVIYLTMGWLAVFFIEDILKTIAPDTLAWVVAGGLSYTMGVYFYVRSEKPYFHTIWHFFVLFGTIAHFVAVYRLV